MARRDGSGRLTLLGSLMILGWLGFVASVFLRPTRGEYNAWLDVGVYNVPFLLAAVACWVRSSRDPARRHAWRALGTGVLLFMGGSVYGSLVVGDLDIYPSPADGLWLSFYVLVYVAIVMFVRASVTRFHASTWLDGAVGGFGVAALVVAFALGPVLANTSGNFSTVATNLSYPTAEILLIIFLITAGNAMHARSASWWLLAAGLAAFCVADVLFLFQQSSGSYAEGGLLDVSWPLGMTLVGLAACVRNPAAAAVVEDRHRFLIPAVFTTSSVLLLAYGQRGGVPPVAAGLALAAISAAAARTVLTVREVRWLAESRREARTDELTGLANRRAFIEGLDASLSGATPHAVMIMDLNGFKEINDSLGHDAGDQLLRGVGARLAEVFSVGGIARLGGDEFGAFVLLDDPDDAVALARRATEALAESYEVAGTTVRVGASIGISMSPLHGRRRGELLRFADIAMYAAKRSRGGISVYDPSRDPNTPERLQSIDELREAILQRQLELHYQPTLDMATGRVQGVEALVRWRRTDGSLSYPDSFIELAERVGLIHELTRAVLEQAISFHASLARTSPGLGISVNISGLDLLDETLAPDVAEILARFSLPPDRLTLEITETALVADLERAERSIVAMRALGVRISVDDFGVGYSSMAQLIGLTVDELKIDRMFVTNLDTDHRMAAIVRSAIELGRALDLNLVAEGVENPAALSILRDLGCDVAQGYHIARPLTPEQLVPFLAAHALRDRPAA